MQDVDLEGSVGRQISYTHEVNGQARRVSMIAERAGKNRQALREGVQQRAVDARSGLPTWVGCAGQRPWRGEVEGQRPRVPECVRKARSRRVKLHMHSGTWCFLYQHNRDRH